MKYTLEQIVNEAIQIMNQSQKDVLKIVPESQLHLTHFGLGLFFRNELNLWQRPVFDDQGNLIHPDDVSMIVIYRIWKKLQERS